MTITGMKVVVDKDEFCRYDPGSSTIIVTATVTAGVADAGEQVHLSVRRVPTAAWPDASCTVMTKLLTATAAQTTFTASFVVGTDDRNAAGIPLARSGRYVAQARLGADEATPTATFATATPFWIVLVPVVEFKRRWCFGANLYAQGVMAVKQAPRTITGVTVLEVAPESTPGKKTLVLTYDGTTLGSPVWTLAWDGGSAVTLDPDDRQTYVLLDVLGEGYVTVEADPAALNMPAAPFPATVSESLVIEPGRMDDATLRDYLRDAAVEAARQLFFFVEPMRVTTDPLQADGDGVEAYYDVVAKPVGIIGRLRFANKWTRVKFPYKQLQVLERLAGYFSETRSLQVDASWFNVDAKIGLVDLVPSAGSIVPFATFGSPLIPLFNAGMEVPAFWHYTGWFGLTDLGPEAGEQAALVRQLIARLAAVEVLTQAGMAATDATMSESTSRDGLSNSRANAPGLYGPYSALVMRHTQWTDKMLPKIRTSIGGLTMLTVY